MKSKYVFAGKKKTGPATAQGLLNISIANTKTGLWVQPVRDDRRRYREVMREGQAVLEEVQKVLL